MSSPLVSVVMPFRDADEFLDAAVASIRAQSLTDFELILIDDGSSDRDRDVARAHLAADARLSLISLPPLGVAGALNCGIEAARAPLVARMDADDIAKPERLEKQVASLAQHPEIGVLGSGVETIDERTGAVLEVAAPTWTPAEIRALLLQCNCVAHPTVMMRRDIVKEVGGYRSIFTGSEDYDLWLRMSERCEIAILPEALLRYRKHRGQATGRRGRLRLLEVLAAQQAARLRRAGYDDPMSRFSRIDAATLRAMGVPRTTIDAALNRAQVAAPPLRRSWLPWRRKNQRLMRPN